MSTETAKSVTHSPSSAERMRLHRKRRRSGTHYVRVLLDATEINALIRKGYLDQKSLDDRDAVEFAIGAFVWDTLIDEQ